MSEPHRRILRSTSIVGGASMVNVFIGLLRNKVAALVLGPAGIGLVGLLHNLMQTVATLVAFGIGNVGTRQVAEATGDQAAQRVALRAMVLAAAALALTGSLLLFFARDIAARLVLGRQEWANEIGWLALGVALLIASAAQNAMLTGLRRIGDLARVSIISALIGATSGVASLLIWGEGALIVFVLLSPIATFIVGAWFVRRLPKPEGPRPTLRQLVPQWRILARLGLAFTIGSLVTTAGQLAVRSMIQQELGTEALGHFQASWTISLNYIGFILTAMAADYYPRLTATMRDREEAVRIVNHQTEIALLLSGPVLIGTVALAPMIVQVLYSSKFLPAADLLRWQIAGDLLKIASWPLGFILLAGGRGRAYMLTEAMGAAVLVAGTAWAIPKFGLLAPGMAYLAMYAVYLPVVFLLARGEIGFVASRLVVTLFAALSAVILAISALAYVSAPLGTVVGLFATGGLAWFSAVRLQSALPASLGALVSLLPGARR